MSNSLRVPDKTVYILGAGFSALAGAPTLSQFIPKAFEILKEKDKDLAKKFAEIIDKYTKIATRIGLDENNLENIFCLVDLPVISSKNKEDKYYRKDRKNLIEAIWKTIIKSMKKKLRGRKKLNENECCWVPHLCLYDSFKRDDKKRKRICQYEKSAGVCVYEAFISYIISSQRNKINNDHIDYYDTIISLNWDLLVESIIRRTADLKVYYQFDNFLDMKDYSLLGDLQITSNLDIKNSIHLLKLHGSFNWKYRKRNKIEPILPSKKMKYNQIAIIPPTWKRSSSPKDFFTTLAGQAIANLQKAAKIVIIGYSMPNIDSYFRYMLAKGLDTPEFPDIEVWDIQKEYIMKPRLMNVFGKRNVENDKIKYFDQGLRGFVMNHPNQTILQKS